MSSSTFLKVLFLITGTCQAQDKDTIHPSSVLYGANRIRLGIWEGTMQEGEAPGAGAGAGRVTGFIILQKPQSLGKEAMSEAVKSIGSR